MKKKWRKWMLLLAIVLLLGSFAYYENQHLVVSTYSYHNDAITEAMTGYTIIQISDLHNASFGMKNRRLIRLIQKQNPDVIVITGDMVDSNHTNLVVALAFAKEVTAICPTYYVTGNHEYWLSQEKRNSFIQDLEATGVKVLKDETEIISVGESQLSLIGLDDNSLNDGTLREQMLEATDLTVVLAHEPQYMNQYATTEADLVLAGHAHGGQFRLPWIGGLVAPDQGFLPTYTAGEYRENQTTMIVSRGLGNSIIPVRLLNDPEVVKIVFE